MVLCVLLALNSQANPHITNLPAADQATIKSFLSDKAAKELGTFAVTFDDLKDFAITVFPSEYDPIVSFTLFNTVAHPRPEDLKDVGDGTVPIKDEGDRIAVGGRIVMDK